MQQYSNDLVTLQLANQLISALGQLQLHHCILAVLKVPQLVELLNLCTVIRTAGADSQQCIGVYSRGAFIRITPLPVQCNSTSERVANTHCPVVEPHEEEPTEESMGDEDSVLPAVPLHHVPVQCLQEGGHTIKHIGTAGMGHIQHSGIAAVEPVHVH